MKNAFLIFSTLILGLTIGACTTAGDPLFQEKDVPVLPEIIEGELIDYATQVQPIFNAKCTMCHGASGGLDLSSYAGLMAGGATGDSVNTCDGVGSYIYTKVTGDPPSMPLGGTPLTEAELEALQLWIDEGANEVPTENSCTEGE
jgi:uncharacterized membrane protein